MVARFLGWTLLAATVAGIAVLFASIFGSIDRQELIDYLPKMAVGLWITIALSLSTFLGGAVAGFILLLTSQLAPKSTRVIRLYQGLFRRTPLLAQLYLLYYGAGEIAVFLENWGLWWLFREALFCVLIVFLFNTTAYQSYILMGCVDNIEKGQREAGLALGLSGVPLLVKVLLPQALRVAVKPLGNELVGVIKASSVASVVTVFDLLGSTQAIYSETFNLNYFFVAALAYVALVEVVRLSFDSLSKKLQPITGRS